MITLETLYWNNCFSYGPDNFLDLTTDLVTQIVGTNGTGKSSIPLIIEEALYNKNSKGIKKADIPNRFIGEGYDITLTLSKDEDKYVIIINRKSGVKATLLKNDEDISSHTATETFKTIQEIIGVDFKTFSQLVYQSTTASLQFLTATDTNRKKFLIDLLQLENYITLFELFKDNSKAISTEISSISGKLSTIEKWLKNNNLTDTTILPMLDITISTESDEKAFHKLKTEIENISEKNKKISRNNSYKQALKGLPIEEAQKIEGTEKKSYDDQQKELGALSGAVTGLKKFLEKVNNLGDACPTCEQKIPPEFKMSLIEDTETELSELRVKGRALQEFIQETRSVNAKIDYRNKIEREWKDLYNSIDQTLPANILDEKFLTRNLKEVSQRISEAKSEIKKIEKENAKRLENNTRIKVIQEQKDLYLVELEELESSLKDLEVTLSNLEVLKKTFSTNGLVAYKIENLVKELEDMVNHYLGELSDGRFTLEFVILNDKLNVEITDSGNVIDILALSSGELARVNTATLLAIRKLMSSISKSKINILFLDEVINVLDEVGREKLVEVLLKEDLNTYIVSHGWSHPLLSKIEVTKDENISKLEM